MRVATLVEPKRGVCVDVKGAECTHVSPVVVVFLLVMGAAIAYLLVSITDIVQKEPAPRRRRSVPASALRPRDGEPLADRLERAAQYTGDRERHFAWMNFGTITGKLTMGAWLSRWWMSGSYMRRRLLASIAISLALMALLGVLLAVFS